MLTGKHCRLIAVRALRDLNVNKTFFVITLLVPAMAALADDKEREEKNVTTREMLRKVKKRIIKKKKNWHSGNIYITIEKRT